MTSNLPEKFLANWTLSDVVMPLDVNKWESAMNTLNDAIRIYASTGSFYVIDSFDTSSSSDLINLVPVSYQSSNNQTLTEYRDGMEINFLCSVVGSSKYVDINVANLGVKQIKKVDSQTRITGNDLIQGFYFSLVYNSSQNCFYISSAVASTDNITINENTNHQLQTIGIIDVNTGNALKEWTGTKAQYDAIATKDANTKYNITDDTDVTLDLLNLLYPVGSIYIGTMQTCPLQSLGVGTWQLKSTNALVTSVNSTAPVVGNGKILGLTSDTNDFFGAYCMDSHGLAQSQLNPAVAELPVLATSNQGTNNRIVGITTDPTKSGIQANITSTSLTVNIWERVS